ncbi:hypothetical protein EM932_01720 [Flavivirga rizhaonensis]|uniref:Uncharacterized protein n=2 Tax=Flavivirga rizhaonensis TaxID=2559571 RepID=A0A4S1E2D3_9FLAO|nr:hypothetical protein EM932_01720 [Flavivirga rizhaonensis]
MPILLETTISCPYCNHKMNIKMSETSIHFIHECNNCKKILRPLEGSCCIFCSYGNTTCPSSQKILEG